MKFHGEPETAIQIGRSASNYEVLATSGITEGATKMELF